MARWVVPRRLSVGATTTSSRSRRRSCRGWTQCRSRTDSAGLLKVTDFGITKIVEGPATTASAVIGTPRYMAPEQILGGRLSPATDLYALGASLYELLAGTPPFDPALPAPAPGRTPLPGPAPPRDASAWHPTALEGLPAPTM